jgi:hypothetical protein
MVSPDHTTSTLGGAVSPDHTTLALATIKAICCRDEGGTRQLLQMICALEDKQAHKLMNKVYQILQFGPIGLNMGAPSVLWLKSTLMPGLGSETLEEAGRRVLSKNTAEIWRCRSNMRVGA